MCAEYQADLNRQHHLALPSRPGRRTERIRSPAQESIQSSTEKNPAQPSASLPIGEGLLRDTHRLGEFSLTEFQAMAGGADFRREGSRLWVRFSGASSGHAEVEMAAPQISACEAPAPPRGEEVRAHTLPQVQRAERPSSARNAPAAT